MKTIAISESEKKSSPGSSKKLRGFLFALTGGILWGFSGTCGQYLFTFEDLDSGWLTVTRMLFSGVILLLVSLPHHRTEMKKIWTNRKDALRLILFALLGLTSCQYTYLTAISWSNAGTATVLQYLGPALIMVVSCLMAMRLPSKKRIHRHSLCYWGNLSSGNSRESGFSCDLQPGIVLGTGICGSTGTLYHASRKSDQ